MEGPKTKSVRIGVEDFARIREQAKKDRRTIRAEIAYLLDAAWKTGQVNVSAINAAGTQ